MSNAEMTLLVIAAAVVLGVGYAIHCAVWPFAACRKCEGDGRHRSPTGKAWRTCRRCQGSGKRVRIGRRLWTWLGARKHDAVD